MCNLLGSRYHERRGATRCLIAATSDNSNWWRVRVHRHPRGVPLGGYGVTVCDLSDGFMICAVFLLR